MIHTVKGFGIVNKAEIDVVLELFCFLHGTTDWFQIGKGVRHSLLIITSFCHSSENLFPLLDIYGNYFSLKYQEKEKS